MLTEQQQLAIDMIREKIEIRDDKNGKLFQLESKAGTGKTFIISYLIDIYGKNNIQICAPTHKACKVLKDKISLNSCNSIITTCHKYFQAVNVYDHLGNQSWKFDEPIVKKKILILDEASMIENNIYNELLKLMGKGVNIITMGDRCQLPPISNTSNTNTNQTESLFYLEQYIDYSMTKNIRNENEDYNEMLEKIRYYILTADNLTNINTYELIDLLKKYLLKNMYRIQMKKIDTSVIDLELFNQYIIDYKEGKKICMLAYRTGRQNTVKELNTRLRKFIFPNSMEDYEVGEKIIFTNYFKKEIGVNIDDGETEVIKYYTSDEDEIIKVSLGKQKFYDETFSVYRLYLKSMEDYRDLFSGEINFNKKLYINMIYNDDENKFEKYNKKIKDKIKLEIKNIRDTCSTICKKKCSEHPQKINELWKFYYEEYYRVKSPIDYAYAMSIHKSQGSTFDKVFICLSDFIWLMYSNEVEDKKLFFKLLYVALSRTKNSSIIF